jgi:alkylated DNA nucleotide flippase Atl1
MSPGWKLAAGKTWRGKLQEDHPNHGKVIRLDAKQVKRFGGAKTLLIPRPRDLDALVKAVPKGLLVTQGELRSQLARAGGADVACPMTTGIFLRIVAEAAEEALRDGKKRVTPYWRVVKDDGALNPKFPGGASGQARRLRDEGHRITSAKTPKVVEHERRLFEGS